MDKIVDEYIGFIIKILQGEESIRVIDLTIIIVEFRKTKSMKASYFSF